MSGLVTIFLIMKMMVPPKVLVRDHSHQEELQAFSQWMIETIDLGDDSYVIIQFSDELPPGRAGATLYQRQLVQGRPVYQFLVLVARDMHNSAQMLVIAHELVHASQIRRHRLSSGEKSGVIWMGTGYTFPQALHYRDRPWEKEARSISASCLKTYLQLQKNGQGTIQ